jgi:methylamine dehydrogenase accessory protein MauD
MNPLLISQGLLWLLVLALAGMVLALARQIGVLHERIAPAGALYLAKGLKVGESAPLVEVTDLAGKALRIGGSRSDGKSSLLLFVSPTCPVCKALLPVARASQRSEANWLEIILASDGDAKTQREFVASQDLASFAYLVSAPLGMAYQINRLPYAVLIDEHGVLRARGIINSREHLESLFEAKRLGVASVQDYLENQAKRGTT